MKILVVNAGSSTHKLSLYSIEGDEPIKPLWNGSLDWGRDDEAPVLAAKNIHGAEYCQTLPSKDIDLGLKLLVETLWNGSVQVLKGPEEVERIGHRVVHGGSRFEAPAVIDSTVKEAIRKLIPLAPLHNSANLRGIELMEEMFPSLIQVAVFDTAFHATMPEIIKTYPVPLEWRTLLEVQRYGFHGISHHYCADRAAKVLQRDPATLKIINCHLGNGCSLCGIHQGISYDTTMGLTPLEGLMMGTRCGSIDPGILLYFMREKGWTVDQLDHSLNFNSGLKGIAGMSDMRELVAKGDDATVQLAIDMFVHRLQTSIGALIVSLGGVDVLSFTAGIGENSSVIRSRVCEKLSLFSLSIDEDKNRLCVPDAIITAPSSHVEVIVLHTEEEWMIARDAFRQDNKIKDKTRFRGGQTAVRH